MNLFGAMVVHNEDWVIGLTARALLLLVDELVVLNHASTDNTLAILDEINRESGNRVHVVHEPDPVFHSITFYERVVKVCKLAGATHVVLLDADELLASCMLPEARAEIEALEQNQFLETLWVPISRSLHTKDTGVRSRWKTGFAFPVENYEYPQIPSTHYDIHWSRIPLSLNGVRPVGKYSSGGLMHLQYVDERRMKAKAVLWKMTELLRWPKRSTVEFLNSWYDAAVYDMRETSPVPDDWWTKYAGWEKNVVIGGESIIERQVKELWVKHKDLFRGLNTFGIV